jgi:hypothetical protein
VARRDFAPGQVFGRNTSEPKSNSKQFVAEETIHMNEIPNTNGTVVGAVKVWLRAEGLAVFMASVVLYRNTGKLWGLFFILFLMPDLFMAGYLINPRIGAASYNLVHTYLWPVALGAACIFFGRFAPLPYILIWTAHIGIDRCLGYGLKYDSAFGHTHLGLLGKAPQT